MVSDQRTDKFRIGLPKGYLKGTQISKTFATHYFAGDNGGFLPNTPDTKFATIFLEKLQVVKGDIVAEKILDEPIRVPGCYYLLNLEVRNYDNEITKAMWQLDDMLLYLDLKLSKCTLLPIPDYCRTFLHDITKQARILGHKAIWVSITLELVKKEVYNEQNPTHRAMMEELNEASARSEAPPTCPVCAKTVPTDYDNYIRMPCGVYCHEDCVWIWPPQLESSIS